MYKMLSLFVTCLLLLQRPMAQAPANTGTTDNQPVTAILGAFGDEINLLLERTENKKEILIQHFRFTEGVLSGRKVVIALTGIGKVNAAITTTLVIEHFHPSEVLFSGIAGGVDPSLSPGDLVIGRTVAYHDFGVLSDSLIVNATRNPITLEKNPIYFPCNDSLVLLAEKVSRGLQLERPKAGMAPPHISTGVIVTGDVFVSSRPATQRLWRQMKAEATDMEGAAVGQTCWQQQVPFLVIRSLSDDAGSNAAQDVARFYQVAARNAATLVIAITGQLCKNHTR